MPEFASRDPSQPDFWNERFAADFKPWDQGDVPPALRSFLAGVAAPGRRVLIPGCGSAYEAGWLDGRGFDVTAIDYSEAALARARRVLPEPIAQRVLRLADFFAFGEPPFDWIYERAFLAALPPALWPAWARRLPQLLTGHGELAGLFFVGDTLPQPRRGPPFVTTRAELDAMLAADFDCLEDEPVPAAQSLPVFASRERWMRWRRR